jgi:hypothetical protein
METQRVKILECPRKYMTWQSLVTSGVVSYGVAVQGYVSQGKDI